VRTVALAVASALAGSAWANPGGPSVAAGAATFSASGNTLNITNAPGTIIHWQQFSIRPDEITRFIQSGAASAVLNRVTGAEHSQLLGQLLSNGRVFLINPNGVTIGAGARIDTAGFVASSLNIADADFLSGRMRFQAVNGEPGKVVNQGAISAASGGSVYLIAPQVGNHGVITAPNGDVLLAAGKSVEVVASASPHIRVEVTAPSGGEALNVGQVVGGRIGIYGGLVRNAGTLNATSAMVGENGNIVLRASGDVRLEGGTVKAGAVDGGAIRIEGDRVVQGAAIEASGASGGTVSIEAGSIAQSARVDASGSSGRGGSIDVRSTGSLVQAAGTVLDASGAGGGGTITVQGTRDRRVFSSAAMDASSAAGGGGEVRVLGDDVVLAGAKLDASGATGGGRVLVGGDFQGANPAVPNAQTLRVASGTRISADATTLGDGGDVVLWADGTTTFQNATITARGGGAGGDGGRVEVSGKERVVVAGLVDASAPAGNAGSLLIDPKNIVIDAAAPTGNPVLELVDPNPGTNESFGSSFVVLGTGYVVATDPQDQGGIGAAYFFDARPGSGTQGALVSQMVGGTAGDQAGSGGVEVLQSSGNFILRSPDWNGGAGALTFGNANAGFAAGGGAVGATNSLVGGVPGAGVANATLDEFVSGLRFALVNPSWNGNRGAVTFGDALAGMPVGFVSNANSIVGAAINDGVGAQGLTSVGPTLNEGVVILSSQWDASRGAATYVPMGTPLADLGNGTIAPIAGTFGDVSAANSLVGAQSNQLVGFGGVTRLSTGNYVVVSPFYSGPGGTETGAGAVTWANGATGVSGAVSAANSLRGNVGDQIGSGGVTELFGAGAGNFVISSPEWGGGRGASTWVNGANGFASGASTVGGFVTGTNSITGVAGTDRVGDSLAGATVTPFANGNYLLVNPLVNNGGGAATLVAGVAGGGGQPIAGGATQPIASVDASNSLLGAGPGAFAGATVQLVSDGANEAYVLRTPGFGGSFGAVTVSPTGGAGAGPIGPISAATSILGTAAGDDVGSGGVVRVAPGRYFVLSPQWNLSAGALTPIDIGAGPAGYTVGSVGGGNSIVGSTAGDFIATQSLYELGAGSGRLLLVAPNWDNGAAVNAGALRFIDASAAVPSFVATAIGALTPANSLVGALAGDAVGAEVYGFPGFGGTGQLLPLSGGRFVVASPDWNDGRGAVTFFTAAGLPTGTVSATNSLVGATGGGFAGDRVGTFNDDGDRLALLDMGAGRYLLGSGSWGPDGTTRATGAVTLVTPAGATATSAGTTGTLDAATVFATSLYGSTPGDAVGGSSVGNTTGGMVQTGPNTVAVASPDWNNGAATLAGAVTFADVSLWAPGAVSGANSLTGAVADDRVGAGGAYLLPGGRLGISSPEWDNGALANAGAFTVVNPAAAPLGFIGPANSLVGGNAGDAVSSSGVFTLSNGRIAVQSAAWNGSRGAITVMDPLAPTTGAASAANSIVGAAAGDSVGAFGLQEVGTGGLVISSPSWGDSRGAFTLVDTNGANPAFVVDAVNSLVGDPSRTGSGGDQIGSGGFLTLNNGNLVLRSPGWNLFSGAVTFVDAGAPAVGVVGAGNSLVGTDPVIGQIGSDVRELPSGDFIVVNPLYGNGAGMIAYGSRTTGVTGTPTALNGWVGTGADALGTNVSFLPGGTNEFVFNAPLAANGSIIGAGRLYIAKPAGLGGGIPFTGTLLFGDFAGADVAIAPLAIRNILDTGTQVVLQASNDILVDSPIDAAVGTTTNGLLRMQAGRSILVNASIRNLNQDSAGNSIHLTANDATATGPRDAGAGELRMAAGTEIVGGGAVRLEVGDGPAPGGLTVGKVAGTNIELLNSAATPTPDPARSIDILPGTVSTTAIDFVIAADGDIRFGTPGATGATVQGGAGTIDVTALGTLTGGTGTLVDLATLGGIGPINLSASSIGAPGQPFGMQYGSQGVVAVATAGGIHLAQTSGNVDTGFLSFTAPAAQQVSYGALVGAINVDALDLVNGNPLRLYTAGGDIVFGNPLLNVNTASLQLDAGGGQINVANGVTFDTPLQTASFMALQGGTTTFNGAATLAGLGVTGNGTTLNIGAGPVSTGSLTWGNFFTLENNTITGNPGATLTVTGATGATISGDGIRTLDNVSLVLGSAAASQYVASFGGGAIDLSGTAGIVNDGILTINNDNPIASPATALNTFVNNGFMTKLNGAGTTVIGGPVGQVTFINNGTLLVSNGRVALANDGTSNGTIDLATAGGGLDLTGGTHVAGGAISGPGALRLTNATLTANGAIGPALTQVNTGSVLTANNALSGQLELFGGTVDVNAAASTAAVTVAGGTLTVAGSLATSLMDISGGTLDIDGAAATNAYNQTGGVVGGTGNLSVASSFGQTGGSFGNTFNALSITQATGDIEGSGFGATGQLALAAPGGFVNIGNPLSLAGSASFFGGAGINVTAPVTAASVGMVTAGTARVSSATVQATNGAISVAAGQVEVTGGSAPAGLLAAAGLNVVTTGDIVLQGGSAAGAHAELNAGNGPLAVSAQRNLKLAGGSGTDAHALVIGDPDVGSKAAPVKVGGLITMDTGSGAGAYARIESVSASSIFVAFPNLATGGYAVDGIEAVTVGNSGFYAGGSPAILDQNLFITYGVPASALVDPNAVLTALNRSTELLGDATEEQQRRELLALFEDIEDAPVCK
jgi:filamentous hemagglutinin family protein